jgi:hypothetical protein
MHFMIKFKIAILAYYLSCPSTCLISSLPIFSVSNPEFTFNIVPTLPVVICFISKLYCLFVSLISLDLALIF